MTESPLTAPWFERARDLVAGLPEHPGASSRVTFRAEDLVWHQVIEDGRIVAWDEGPVDDPDLVLAMPRATALAAHRPGADGNALLATCSVEEPVATGSVPSPCDVGYRPELADLPEIPGADLTIQYHLADGPFGDVDVWWRFEDGRSAEIHLGTTPDRDVEAWIPYTSVHAVRSGDMSILEALAAGGRVEGEEGPLMLYAGLEESAEFQAVGRSCGPCGRVFGVLGVVRADPVFQAALAELASEIS